MDIIVSLLGGGFAGAGVVIFLSKWLIKNQLLKSLKKYQHELDVKKDSLGAELTIFVENAKLNLTNHIQKRIVALEAIYSCFVGTSLQHHGFKRSGRPSAAIVKNEHQMNAEYFQLFSENFQAFSKAYQSISLASASLEDNAIYLNDDIENQVIAGLTKIKACYDTSYLELQHVHTEAQNLFRNNLFNTDNRNFNFNAFNDKLVYDWGMLANPVKHQLKSKLRELLSPDKQK